MSPIFVRPVREQLEHDRLIRLLQAKYKRKFDVQANLGEERVAPIKIGPNVYYPDLVLWQGNKLAGLVEVETGESVNNLEAMAQWTHFTHARVPFHLYVPLLMIDAARRLAAANQSHITELWTYRLVGDDYDFVRAFHDGSALAAAAKLSPKLIKAEKVIQPEKPVEPVAPPKPEPEPVSKPAGKSKSPAPAPKPVPAKPAPARPVVKASKKPAASATPAKKPVVVPRPAVAKSTKPGSASKSKNNINKKKRK